MKYFHTAFLLFLCKRVFSQLKFSILQALARLQFVQSTVRVFESNLQCILLCTPVNTSCCGLLGIFKTERQHRISGITSWHYWAAADLSVTFFFQQDVDFKRIWLGLGLCALLSFLWCCLCWEALRRKTGETLLHRGEGRSGPRKGKVRSSPGQSRWGSTRSWQRNETIRDHTNHAALVHCLSMDDPPVICSRKLSRAHTVCTINLFAQSFLGMLFVRAYEESPKQFLGVGQGSAWAGSHPQRQSKYDYSVLESKGF